MRIEGAQKEFETFIKDKEFKYSSSQRFLLLRLLPRQGFGIVGREYTVQAKEKEEEEPLSA